MSSEIATGEHNTPVDLPSMKMMIDSLNVLGSWPYETIGKKKWKYRNGKFVCAYLTMCFCLGLAYMIKHFSELTFFTMGRVYICIIMCFIAMQRLTTTWTKSYQSVTYEFIDKFHLLHHKEKGNFAIKMYDDIDKISLLFSKMLHYELYLGTVLYNLTPLINNYRKGMFSLEKPINGTFEHACNYVLPFDYDTKFWNFLIVHIFNWFASYDVASCFCIIDLYIFTIVFQIWGHFKILKHNLRSLPRPKDMNDHFSNKVKLYNEEESLKIKQLLIESMEHYRLIKDFMTNFSMGFGSLICWYYLFHQISGCVFLVEMSELTADAFGTYGMLTLNLFQQLIQMSIIFELIGTQSETVKDAVYDVPWEYMGTENRKIVIMYLCNVQTPMNFKALGILPVGVQTMASILKTTISYFMLLRTSRAEHK